MYEAVVMHMFETFQNLDHDVFRFGLWQRSCEVPLQVPVFEILHGYEDGVPVLEPSIRVNEAMGVLVEQRRLARSHHGPPTRQGGAPTH